MSDKMGISVLGNIDWTKLKKIKVTHQDKESQWKCLHNINHTEQINLANGKCHLCQIKDNDEMIQHLLFEYHSAREKKVLSTQTIKKKNKRGHVVLATPFTFCLLKNVGSHAKNSGGEYVPLSILSP